MDYSKRRREDDDGDRNTPKRPRTENVPPPSQAVPPPSQVVPEGMRTIELTTNYFQVDVALNQDIIQYDVKIEPKIEKAFLIRNLISQHDRELRPYIWNKFTMWSLKDFGNKVLESRLKRDDRTYKVILTKTAKVSRENSPQVYFQIFNVAFKQILENAEGLVPLGKRGLFDPRSKKKFADHKIEIWPGFVSSLFLSGTGKILINGSLIFKIFRLEKVSDVLKRYDRDTADMRLRDQIVFTAYGSKYRTYRIKSVDWSKTPESTFERQKGGPISYQEYYYQVYHEKVSDRNQPLLIVESSTERRQKRKNLPRTQTSTDVFLIPELCSLTGLTDDMRSERSLMTSVSSVTRLSAQDRMKKIEDFVYKFSNPKNSKIQEYLQDWKIKVSEKPLKFTGRVISPPPLIFGGGKEYQVGNRGDWGDFWKNHLQFIKPVPIKKWLVLTPVREEQALSNLLRYFPQIAKDFGMQLGEPVVIKIDRDDEWDSNLKDHPKLYDFTICILSSPNAVRYNKIKERLTAVYGLVSQCVIGKSISSADRVQSVITKITQQINSKLGGSIWNLKIPLPPGKTMVCGIDICHDKIRKSSSYAGFVATTNRTCDNFFSRAIVLTREADLVNGLTNCMTEALECFKGINASYPDNIIIYRDGVGDSRLKEVKDVEIKQLQDAFRQLRGVDGHQYSPNLVFIVVQKKINTRLFTTDYTNPPPGTIADTDITSLTRENQIPEFYLIPQYVQSSATVCPSRYLVVKNDLGANHIVNLQRLTFLLCHLYFNWSGTVRVPAPVQYATKLSFHVSQHLSKAGNINSNVKQQLYYL